MTIQKTAGIKIEQLSMDDAKSKGITSWPIWEKEKSQFDWTYDSLEECYFLEGKVTIKTDEGTVQIGAGDFVSFPQGLSCVWKVQEPVRKHYRFQ